MKNCMVCRPSWNKPRIARVIDFFDAMPSHANYLTANDFWKF